MTPTPEQIQQWAREAGIEISAPEELPSAFRVNVRRLSDLHRFATLACAWQAEQDANLCEQKVPDCWPTLCATAIRSNAPKVTT